MRFQPIGDRVVVKRLEGEETTPGGMVRPAGTGKVLAVSNFARGADGARYSIPIHEGETVLFAKYAGVETKIEGEDVLVLREEDILGILPE